MDVGSRPEGPLRVLGIDPGTRFLGWAVIEEADRKRRALGYDTLKADPKAPLEQRLAVLAGGLREVLARFAPQEAAIEETFHGRDARAALKLGEARGMILLVVAEGHVKVTGYANNVVKRSVAGAGRASKDRVQAMVMRILGLTEAPAQMDASDALALALCHLQRRTTPGGEPGGPPPRLAAAIDAAKRRRR